MVFVIPVTRMLYTSHQPSSIMKLRLQLIMSVVLASFGLILMMLSFFVPPMGVIDSSVLVATGEVFTFSGSLMGIDYHYKLKSKTS